MYLINRISGLIFCVRHMPVGALTVFRVQIFLPRTVFVDPAFQYFVELLAKKKALKQVDMSETPLNKDWTPEGVQSDRPGFSFMHSLIRTWRIASL